MHDRIQEDKVVGGKGEQNEMKKIWQKPKLIILARGGPEESVLAGCKMKGKSVSTRNKNTGCQKAGCGLCNAKGTS